MTDRQEGQRLPQIVRRGSTSSVRYRRAMMLASAGGNRVPVIAQLVQADEDTVRDGIHRFNARHPDVLAAHRRERARTRSEKGVRGGGRRMKVA